MFIEHLGEVNITQKPQTLEGWAGFFQPGCWVL